MVEVAATAVSHLWLRLLHSYWEGHRDILLTNLINDSIDQSISFDNFFITRSLGALWAQTSSWKPFGPLDFILRAQAV